MQKSIDNLSLDQKIGQMFMGNICGGETLDIARGDLEKFHFGGMQFSGLFETFIRGGGYRPCGVCRNEPLAEVYYRLGRQDDALDTIARAIAIDPEDNYLKSQQNRFRGR